jgi:hypothetical protein
MKKSLLCTILKQGRVKYIESPVPKANTLQRMLSRWNESKSISIPDNMKSILTGPLKKSDLTSVEKAELKSLCTHGRQRDCVQMMTQCLSYYVKRHRFKFSEEIQDIITKPMTYDICSGVFEETVEQFEAKHKFFEKSLSVKRNQGNPGRIIKIGPFNKYVKDQWNKRREELRGVCLKGKSTDVMKLLSTEWNADTTLRKQYTE